MNSDNLLSYAYPESKRELGEGLDMGYIQYMVMFSILYIKLWKLVAFFEFLHKKSQQEQQQLLNLYCRP